MCGAEVYNVIFPSVIAVPCHRGKQILSAWISTWLLTVVLQVC